MYACTCVWSQHTTYTLHTHHRLCCSPLTHSGQGRGRRPSCLPSFPGWCTRRHTLLWPATLSTWQAGDRLPLYRQSAWGRPRWGGKERARSGPLTSPHSPIQRRHPCGWHQAVAYYSRGGGRGRVQPALTENG